MIRIDGLFKEVGTNSDKQAVKLAKQLMDNAEMLTEVDTSHLSAIERELGRDLTNGQIERRSREIELGMSVPAANELPDTPENTQEPAAK